MIASITAVILAALFVPQDLRMEVAAVHGRFDGQGAPIKGTSLTISEGRLTEHAASPAGSSRLLLPSGHTYPGLIDAHGHLRGLGQALDIVDLRGASSWREVVDRVRQRAATIENGNFVLGRGWDQNLWQSTAMPDHRELSIAVPDHPVLLTRIDGHAAVVNALAMTMAGLTAETGEPVGGEILRDETGAPTGVLIDRAMALVSRLVERPTAGDRERWLLAAQDACLKAGLTMVHDAGTDPEDLEILKALHTSGRWHLRVYAMVPIEARETIQRGPWQTPDGVLIVRAVKDYADGALGSYGAALHKPYHDDPRKRGFLLKPAAMLVKNAQFCADHGFQYNVHAIGDLANAAALDAIAAVRTEIPLVRLRSRIEHAQVVAAEDFARFASLGVIASMQPTHMTSDMPWAERRLGPDRIGGAYAWQTFLGLGVTLALGSDFPVESSDPRKGLFAAVTTRPERGGPDQGYFPDQRMSVAQALHGFTQASAHAAFQERDLGSLEVGKWGDCTIFDRDLATCPPEELLAARVLATVIAGRVVYRAPDR